MNERNEFMLSFDPKVQKREFHLSDAHTYSDRTKVLAFFSQGAGGGGEGFRGCVSGKGLIILLVGIGCTMTRYRCVVIIRRHQAAVYAVFLVL